MDDVRPDRRRLLFWLVAILLAAVAVSYAPVVRNDFINYDDQRYVTQNPHVQAGLTRDSIRWAFTTLFVANWHPLTWLSHMLDWEMFRWWAGGHHLVNLLLHAANAALLLILLHRMTGALWPSALAAAWFGVHPLHVESVAWVAERKDVLSTFFGLCSVIGYLAFTRRGGFARRNAFPWLANSLICFALSLMAKPMLVTLPFALLLLDVWPLRRMRRGRAGVLIVEKLPYLALAAASCVVTVIAQSRGEAVVSLERIPLDARIGNAVVSYATYLQQTVWPRGLVPLYPHQNQPASTIAIAASVLAAITVIAIVRWRRNPHLLIGWLWFLGTLVPVIGLVQVGVQAHADRYTYVPLIGVFIMVAWSLPLPEGRAFSSGRSKAAAAFGLATILACGSLTFIQTRRWRDSLSLFSYTLAIKESPQAHFNYANALADHDRLDEAASHYLSAAALDSHWADIPNNLGNLYARQGDFDQAIVQYERSLSLKRAADILCNLGQALTAVGRDDDALARFKEAVELDPRLADARLLLGNALAARHAVDEALAQFDEARRLDPANLLPPLSKACVLVRNGRLDEADIAFRAAAALDPQGIYTTIAYGQALLDAGEAERAIKPLLEARERAERLRQFDDVQRIDAMLQSQAPASSAKPRTP